MFEKQICKIAGYEDIQETYYLILIGNRVICENRKYKNPKILKAYIKKGKSNKYPCIKPATKNNKSREIRIHRLIGLAFIENPYNYSQLNHINNIKSDYSINNLEWTSPKANINQMNLDKKIINNQINIFGTIVKKEIKKVELSYKKQLKNQISLLDFL